MNIIDFNAGTYLIIVGALIILSCVALRANRPRLNHYHRRMQNQSSRALILLKSRTPGAIIAYMRKMNPHAVEELVLDAAENAGHKVRRNTSYTGDGGIDGQICVDGVWHLVQTKRYSSSINPRHVADFSALCALRRQPGLFIHCGRTGAKSRANAAANIRFISGEGIVSLIKGQTLNSKHSHAPAQRLPESVLEAA